MMSRLARMRAVRPSSMMALSLSMMVGMGALVLDVGHWFRDKRRFRERRMPPRLQERSSCRRPVRRADDGAELRQP